MEDRRISTARLLEMAPETRGFIPMNLFYKERHGLLCFLLMFFNEIDSDYSDSISDSTKHLAKQHLESLFEEHLSKPIASVNIRSVTLNELFRKAYPVLSSVFPKVCFLNLCILWQKNQQLFVDLCSEVAKQDGSVKQNQMVFLYKGIVEVSVAHSLTNYILSTPFEDCVTYFLQYSASQIVPLDVRPFMEVLYDTSKEVAAACRVKPISEHYTSLSKAQFLDQELVIRCFYANVSQSSLMADMSNRKFVFEILTPQSLFNQYVKLVVLYYSHYKKLKELNSAATVEVPPKFVTNLRDFISRALASNSQTSM
jgi:hypothetical protein